MQTSYFYSAVLGLLAGTVLLLLDTPIFVVVGLSVLIAFVFIVFAFYRLEKSSLLVLVAVFLIGVSVGAVRVGVANNPSEATALQSVVNTRVAASGTVVSRPSVSGGGQQFTARIQSATDQSASTTATGPVKAVVYAPAYPQINYGDRIDIHGRLQKPESFSGNYGRTFAYPQYLARKGIYYEINQPDITQTGDGGGNLIKRKLAVLQNKLLAAIKSLIPKPESGLAGGVLLGAEDELGNNILSDFRSTSVVHVVVLSGFHVTVVATAIGKGLLLAGLPLAGAMSFAGLGIMLFVLLVGLSPTIIRASIMAVFAMIARVSGRQYAAGRGLSLAVVGMVLVSPNILLYDPSFQLSVAATAGLIMFGDYINDWLVWVPQQWGLREVATATISAQLMVLPLILYHMGTLSLVSLPANLLVLPVVPVLMTVVAITAVLGLISSVLGFAPAFFVYLLAGYVIGVVQWLAGIPGAAVSVPPFPVWLVLVMYAVIFMLYFYLRTDNSYAKLPTPEDN